MKFDVNSTKILTPTKVELNVLRVSSFGPSFYIHNNGGNPHNYGYEGWKLTLLNNKRFKPSEIPYLRGMSFIITDSFTTFFIRCYAVQREREGYDVDHGDYTTLVCQDVANGEFLEGAERTNRYKMIFDPNFKGQLPELDNSL